MTKTVAITGATGFIGKHIVQNLLAHGFHVRALTRTVSKSADSKVAWISGSLENQQSLQRLVSGADYVVHCAGQVRGRTEATFVDCNVQGSKNLMQAALESGQCQRFLFMSSLAARHPELSWYAKSKHTAEQQLTAMRGNMTLGIFRPTAVYGPGDKELKPLFSWLLRGVLPKLGAAEAQLTFVHVTDVAEAVSQWLLAPTPHSETYELCDAAPAGYSWQRVQQIGCSVRNGPVRLITVPLPALKVLADISVGLSRLARKEPMLTHSKIRELTHPDWSASYRSLSEHINWTPKIDLERALREGQF
ncbi:NAD-dependent epimerase/dehydratase family protein [Candidatus Pantoea multigeneris]|uniref:SDR family NAD(P)-dependent oxidoreductase n=1 Tax=Candidatus Pantoea multigeneris TaxID=2608357 RepID=A0ABX0RC15_9GAMM|nr:SDR family NAD(P)-dependent oxidoreductase [Pantoea multigeneris]NIF22895.1 SDR family NAD(P)-dependent oxidoreductase [Pantoea multigeneris]